MFFKKVTARYPLHRMNSKSKGGASGLKVRVRFPGIVVFAARFGVTRQHAWQVLTGQRSSRSLTAAWRRFRKEKDAI